MTGTPDRAANGAASGNDAPRIVISGLDEPEWQAGEAHAVNLSPTDEAVKRLQQHRERGEPEDEDG